MKNKFILIDIDRVCLDWSKQFDRYLAYYHPNEKLDDALSFPYN